MMRDAVLNFAQQFSYTPKVECSSRKKYKKYIVAGMGGSHLSADILKAYDPSLSIVVHSDYGLPYIPLAEKKDTLVIASSYSGNTEETIDAFLEARKKRIDCAALSVGGTLAELARKAGVPYVQISDTGIQPRSALGFSLKALLSVMGLRSAASDLSVLAKTLKPASIEKSGQALAVKLRGCVPVVYASARNEAVAYNWKIKLNETGKIPSFYNVLPELNHNEMTGFDVADTTKTLSEKFCFLFLEDEHDHARIQKRMKILMQLYKKRGLACILLPLKGDGRWMRIFSSLVLADWTAVAIAEHYGLESEQVPMVEEFKKLMTK